LRVNGINISYYDRGVGESIVFLHGWGSDYSIFQKFLDGMTGAYRVIAPDLPGFGGSGEPPRGWSVGDYADFVAYFLADLGVTRAIFIGHSFGGRIAIKLAERGELEIPKTILIDSAGIRHRRTASQKIRSMFYKLAKKILSVDFMQKKFPRQLEIWRMKNSSSDYRNASARMRECLVKVVSEDLTPLLSSITCPTLLMWGEDDLDTPLSDARIMERLIPNAGLVILKNAGHYSFLDQSYTFGRVLDSFLNIKRPA
jgi:pimeloyl-ACP methyl ester carboxylesterase